MPACSMTLGGRATDSVPAIDAGTSIVNVSDLYETQYFGNDSPCVRNLLRVNRILDDAHARLLEYPVFDIAVVALQFRRSAISNYSLHRSTLIPPRAGNDI